MALYRCEVKHVSRTRNSGGGASHVKYLAADHAKYLEREGPAKGRKDLEFCLSGNMPEFARDNPKKFWLSADRFERANGRVYIEFIVTMPRGLSAQQRKELLKDFIEATIGTRFPYTAAIHNPFALDGKEQPHAHIIASTRELDGIERTPQKYFSRYNPKNPERGGARKADDWRRWDREATQIQKVRESWERCCNIALERAGLTIRVDRRSLKDRGLDRAPEPKMGPGISQRLKAGKATEIGRTVLHLRKERHEFEELERQAATTRNAVKQREQQRHKGEVILTGPIFEYRGDNSPSGGTSLPPHSRLYAPTQEGGLRRVPMGKERPAGVH